jgi:hypothetical protein
MRYTVEAYENQSLFKGEPGTPVLFTDPEHAAWAVAQPTAHVCILNVEASSVEGAANAAFEIANAPWEPADLTGATWPHRRSRSMSSGDIVYVRTPNGNVGFVCMSFGWHRISSENSR